MSLVTLNQENFNSTIEKEKLILVDFWAPWCGPCKMMEPIIEELANNASGYSVTKLNIDENQKIAEKYNVMSVPSFLLFKEGKIVEQANGAVSKESLLALISKHKSG
ncbi:MAG: thioredoxin 1 [Candidatus Berkelbacteria bacterium Athens1014_28]|uniref:Thioredoxin n=1 Tax=Candidatus Berkelbacteria bacterium Athens1014_28 TaxID=2017145 RepID=A0A554LN27_9BACT|nr:MAG: thioredoxin 1 [Candidatus Berkelbacteria bacterium Athens1014_28]